MGISVLNEKQLAAAVRATWSLTTSEVSGPDCMGIVDAETGTEIEGEIFGTSARTTVVASV